jgi:predicted DNA-binding protein
MPKIKKYDTKLEQIMISSELLERLRNHSEKSALSKAAITRIAIERYLEKVDA